MRGKKQRVSAWTYRVRVADSNDGVFANEDTPMNVTDLTVERVSLATNAIICLTHRGMTTEVRAEPMKAFLPMDVTPLETKQRISNTNMRIHH